MGSHTHTHTHPTTRKQTQERLLLRWWSAEDDTAFFNTIVKTEQSASEGKGIPVKQQTVLQGY